MKWRRVGIEILEMAEDFAIAERKLLIAERASGPVHLKDKSAKEAGKLKARRGEVPPVGTAKL